MTDKHDNMNTGFEDVVDFCEPVEDISSCSQKNLSSAQIPEVPGFLEGLAQKGVWGAVLANNLRALVIHLLLVVVGTLLLLLFGFYGEALMAVLALVGYPLLAFKYLERLPKFNFLSTLVLFLLLSVYAGVYYLLSHGEVLLYAAFGNLPAVYLVYLSGIFFPDPFAYLSAMMLVASILPSLLMYLGLCVKALHNERALTASEHDDINADFCKFESAAGEAVTSESSTPSNRLNLRKVIVRNNLIACLLHVVATVLALAWFLFLGVMGASLIQSQIEQAIFAFVFMMMPMIALYVYLGYRFVRPLPKSNFVSVLAPLVIFLTSSLLALIDAPVVLAGGWENIPFYYFAVAINLLGYGIVVAIPFSLPDIVDDSLMSVLQLITLFVGAFIPSSFMYLGIRLNAKYASRQELNKVTKFGEGIARGETFEEIPSDWSEEVFRTGEESAHD